VIFSGEPTFTGFIKLDDTSTWLAMTDRVLSHGHSLAGLPLSTYEATLYYNLAGAEPVGSLLAWGIGHQIVGQDLAWTFQPYLAFLGAMTALAGWSLVRLLVRSRVLCGFVVFVAAQATLIYGYSLWGGVKEVAAAWALAVTAAATMPIFDSGARVRSFLPLAAGVFATLGVLGWGGAVWLPAVLLAAGLWAFWVWWCAQARLQLGALAVVTVGGIVGLILGANAFLAANGPLTTNTLGNLAHPLSGFQAFGIWPATDFRVDPPRAAGLTYLLIALVILAACLGAAWAWRSRAWSAALYLVSAGIGVLIVSAKGGPWVQGKAFAIASPAPLLLALAGAAVLIEAPPGLLAWERRSRITRLVGGRHAVGLSVCALLAVGVLWGNVLNYGHVTLAPYGQMSELSYIGQRFAGPGPTMINENEPYAGRHFLRDMAAESPSDLRVRQDQLRGGALLQEGQYADLDQFALQGLLVYRTIVMRTSPVASRPPAPYHLVYNGKWYQVWQKPPGAQRPVVDLLPLGSKFNPAGVPACSSVLDLAREAGGSGLLAAAGRAAPTGIAVPGRLPNGNTVERFQVATPGVYEIWLGGSVVGHLVTSVDGKQIGSTHEVLDEPGGYLPLGRLRLRPGLHTVVLSYSGTSLAPGSAGPGNANDPFTDGPLEISPPPGNVPLTYVTPNHYRTLCGKAWDWIEALGP
jgi:hypothetical protein